MTRAIHFWTIRGESIGFYEHNPPDSICDSKEMIHGFIVLRKAKWWQIDGTTLASTRRMTTGFTMVAATITYKPGSQNFVNSQSFVKLFTNYMHVSSNHESQWRHAWKIQLSSAKVPKSIMKLSVS